jgi:hypothetical protein
MPAAAKVQESKPGVRTTEFWVSLFSNVAGLIQLTTGTVDVSNKYVAIALGIINGAYAVSRGLAKQGQPFVE